MSAILLSKTSILFLALILLPVVAAHSTYISKITCKSITSS